MYCRRCGTDMGAAPEAAKGARRQKCPACGMPTRQPVDSETPQGAQALLLEPGERYVAALSRGVLSNLSLGGQLAKDSIVLSDRRLYMNGRAFSGSHGLHEVRVLAIIPLEHISGVYFKVTNRIGLLALGLMTAALFVFSKDLRHELASVLSPALYVLTFALLAMYALTTSRHLAVSSASETVNIRYQAYGEERVAAFLSKLARAITYNHRRLQSLRRLGSSVPKEG